MIAHVVMLKPRANLTADERQAFVAAFETAATRIPSVREVRVGSRIKSGLGYEAGMPDSADFLALITFDDLAGLHAYLNDPAHQELGRLFASALTSALVYDFEVGGLDTLRRLVS
jgi:hypothetical protein